jgi:3-hydroxymyristoyl/3-hydroxydecanoyl-(acyl carrier protein) dehydratase
MSDSFQLAGTGAAGPERRFRVEIPATSPLFAGHFPGRPILPGIAHLAFVERALGSPLAAVRSLKLRRLVAPGEALDLLLFAAEGNGWTRFEVRHGEEVVSGGSVTAGEAGMEWTEEGASPSGEDLPVTLPHTPPARLVRRVIEAAAGEIVCVAEVPASHPLAAGDRFPAFLGIEAAAQAAAVLEGIEALGRREAASGPRIGYLVGIREAHFAVPSLPVDLPFRVTARLQGSAPPLSIYEITARGAGGAVAGTLSTFLADS